MIELAVTSEIDNSYFCNRYCLIIIGISIPYPYAVFLIRYYGQGTCALPSYYDADAAISLPRMPTTEHRTINSL